MFMLLSRTGFPFFFLIGKQFDVVHVRYFMLRSGIFIMGSTLWLYQTQGLIKIWAPVTSVTKLNLSKITHKRITRRKKNFDIKMV